MSGATRQHFFAPKQQGAPYRSKCGITAYSAVVMHRLASDRGRFCAVCYNTLPRQSKLPFNRRREE